MLNRKHTVKDGEPEANRATTCRTSSSLAHFFRGRADSPALIVSDSALIYTDEPRAREPIFLGNSARERIVVRPCGEWGANYCTLDEAAFGAGVDASKTRIRTPHATREVEQPPKVNVVAVVHDGRRRQRCLVKQHAARDEQQSAQQDSRSVRRLSASLAVKPNATPLAPRVNDPPLSRRQMTTKYGTGMGNDWPAPRWTIGPSESNGSAAG
uniref:Uncharacterized protein n=1 Tax=Plectus sambesii TaxID=2011161 RepID=A0A914WL78_9BILA